MAATYTRAAIWDGIKGTWVTFQGVVGRRRGFQMLGETVPL